MNVPAPSHAEDRVRTITSVFTLHDRADQDTLYELLDANAADILEHTPGFLGSTLSRSDDDTTVVHHATWRDEHAVQAMLSAPSARAQMARTRQLAAVHVIRANINTCYGGASVPRSGTVTETPFP